MQIALLGLSKSIINNTYTTKVLKNGLKFWNAVSVGLQIILLKYFVVVFHAVWFVEKSKTPWSIKLFKAHPDLDGCKIFFQNMEVIFIQYFTMPPKSPKI